MFKIQIKTYTRIFGMIVDHYSIQIYKDTNIIIWFNIMKKKRKSI